MNLIYIYRYRYRYRYIYIYEQTGGGVVGRGTHGLFTIRNQDG